MQVYCKTCRWSYDLPGATAPGFRLKAAKCVHCKRKGVLTRYKKALRDGTLAPDQLRAGMRRLVRKAARTGTLPDGSPLSTGTAGPSLLEQMSGLGVKARRLPHLTDFAARKARVAAGLEDVRAAAVEGLALQQRATRAAVISAKATKRELRKIASATGALVELARALVQTLDTRLGELYAAADVLVEYKRREREDLAAARKAARNVGTLPDVEDGPADLSDPSVFAEPIANSPQPGDVLTFEGGETWTVSGSASGAILVAQRSHESAAVHEQACTLEEWRNAVAAARKVERPGTIELERNGGKP
ncbi:hypothetical protein EDM80_07310 [bacterium]|nr:MAG: hypothetical protein EDM80_07310 [bacterium]RIK65425.1 MAG: hypothetical protein DCC64_01955 [Planctomycetota bacterium]